jgi:hypothetical protein
MPEPEMEDPLPLAAVLVRAAASLITQQGGKVRLLIPRQAGVVAQTREIADRLGLNATVDISAASICIRLRSGEPGQRRLA